MAVNETCLTCEFFKDVQEFAFCEDYPLAEKFKEFTVSEPNTAVGTSGTGNQMKKKKKTRVEKAHEKEFRKICENLAENFKFHPGMDFDIVTDIKQAAKDVMNRDYQEKFKGSKVEPIFVPQHFFLSFQE